MECVTCGGTTENELYEFHLCTPCLDQVFNAIRATPGLLRILAVTVSNQARVGDGGRRARAQHGSAPINVAAADWKYELQGAITNAALAVARVTKQSPPFAAGIEHVCVWLAEKSDWLALNPSLAEHQGIIVKAYEAACRSVDRPADRVTVGRCGVKRIEGVCDRELVIGLRQSEVVCPECKTVWDVHERRANALSASWVQPVRPPVIVKALKIWGFQVTLKAVEHWIERDLLKPVMVTVGKDGPPVKRYRFTDAYDLALRMEKRRENAKSKCR